MSQHYCGYKNSPKFLRKILSYKFNDSCKIHDKNYKETSKLTRKEADLRFLEDCKEQAKGSVIWTCFAYLYYYAVRIMGSIAFESNNKDDI